MIKKCIICGREIKRAPSHENVTCGSPECTSIYKKRLFENDENFRGNILKNLNKAHENIKTNPLTGKFETNHSGKTIVIVSPTGEKYTIHNMIHWARENENITGINPATFARGIAVLKRCLTGARKKNVVSHYRGWTIEKYYDYNLLLGGKEPKPSKLQKRFITEEERAERHRRNNINYYYRKKENKNEN